MEFVSLILLVKMRRVSVSLVSVGKPVHMSLTLVYLVVVESVHVILHLIGSFVFVLKDGLLKTPVNALSMMSVSQILVVMEAVLYQFLTMERTIPAPVIKVGIKFFLS